MTTGIGLGISRRDHETWLAALVRHAAPYGLEEDAAKAFLDLVPPAGDQEESDAAISIAIRFDIAQAEPTLTVADQLTQLRAEIEEQAKRHEHEMWGMQERIRELEDQAKAG